MLCLAVDNDDAGTKGAKIGTMLRKGTGNIRSTICQIPADTKEKDLDDLVKAGKKIDLLTEINKGGGGYARMKKSNEPQHQEEWLMEAVKVMWK